MSEDFEAQGNIFEDVPVAKDARHEFSSTHEVTQANKVIPWHDSRCILGQMSDSTLQHLVQDREARTSHNAGDDSGSASSVTSLADSLFSTTSGSSRSSVIGPAGAGETLALLLLSDRHLSIHYQEAVERVTADKFERNFRQLLKRFALELRKDAETPQQRSAAHFVRYQARNTAHIIRNSIYSSETPREVVRPNLIVLDEAANIEFDESESDSGPDDDDHSDVQQLENFIITSPACRRLRNDRKSFVYPLLARKWTLEVRRCLKKQVSISI